MENEWIRQRTELKTPTINAMNIMQNEMVFHLQWNFTWSIENSPDYFLSDCSDGEHKIAKTEETNHVFSYEMKLMYELIASECVCVCNVYIRLNDLNEYKAFTRVCHARKSSLGEIWNELKKHSKKLNQ